MAIVIPVKDLHKKLPELIQGALATDANQGSGQDSGGNAEATFGSLGVVLRSQAVRRIHNSGDSTHKYPELWANKVEGHYRSGGKPLQDTGALMASLHSETKVSGNRISLNLKDGSPGGYGVYHQAGFTTKGPNFIPMSPKGRRGEPKLKYGKDFIIAKGGVTVPQRKIFNLPPEDRKELGEAIVNAITKMR